MSAVVKTTGVSFEASETTPDILTPAPIFQDPPIPHIPLESIWHLALLYQDIEGELKKHSQEIKYDFFNKPKSSNVTPVTSLEIPSVASFSAIKEQYVQTGNALHCLMKNLPADGKSDAVRTWFRETMHAYVPAFGQWPASNKAHSTEFQLTIRRVNLSIEELFKKNDETFTNASESLKSGLYAMMRYIYPFAITESISQDTQRYANQVNFLSELVQKEPVLFRYTGFVRWTDNFIIIIPRKT